MRAHSNAPTYCGNLWQKWLVHFPLRDMSIDQPGPGRTWWFLSIAPIAAGLPAILTHQTIPAILRCTQTHNVIFMQGGIPARRRVAFASTGLCIWAPNLIHAVENLMLEEAVVCPASLALLCKQLTALKTLHLITCEEFLAADGARLQQLLLLWGERQNICPKKWASQAVV